MLLNQHPCLLEPHTWDIYGGRDVSRVDMGHFGMPPLVMNVNELFSSFLHFHQRKIVRAGAVIFDPEIEVSVDVSVRGLLLALVCLPWTICVRQINSYHFSYAYIHIACILIESCNSCRTTMDSKIQGIQNPAFCYGSLGWLTQHCKTTLHIWYLIAVKVCVCACVCA